MQFTAALLFLAPLLATASPVERAAEDVKACCYRSDVRHPRNTESSHFEKLLKRV